MSRGKKSYGKLILKKTKQKQRKSLTLIMKFNHPNHKIFIILISEM